eukprot:159793_1
MSVDTEGALDVISAYIRDNNGYLPSNHNALVSYSCEMHDLPTLDDNQAKNIIAIYRSTLTKVRSQQNSPRTAHTPSPRPPRSPRRPVIHRAHIQTHHNHSNARKRVEFPRRLSSSDSEHTDMSNSANREHHPMHQYHHTKTLVKSSPRNRRPPIYIDDSDQTPTESTTDMQSTDTMSDEEHQSFKHRRKPPPRHREREHGYTPARTNANTLHQPRRTYPHTHVRTATAPDHRRTNYRQQRTRIQTADAIRSHELHQSYKYPVRTIGDLPQHQSFSPKRHNTPRKQFDDVRLHTPHYNQSSDDTQQSDSTRRSSSSSSSAVERYLEHKTYGLFHRHDGYTSPKRNINKHRTHSSHKTEPVQHLRYTATNTRDIEMEAIPRHTENKQNSEPSEDIMSSPPTTPRYDVYGGFNEKMKTKPQSEEGSQDSEYSKMESKMCRIVRIVIIIVICCIGVILAIVLIPLSMRKVEFDEHALRYNDVTKEVDSEEYSEGRYIFTPSTKMFRYESIIQKMSFNLECLSKDGIAMGVNVTAYYSISQDKLFDIWNDYGKEGSLETYFRLVVDAAIRDAVSTFKAKSFYEERYTIQNAIEIRVFEMVEEYSHTYVDMSSVIMTGYSFPELLKETIRIKRNAETDIELARNQRAGNITDAQTVLLVAGIHAGQIEIQAQAEYDSIIKEGYAKGETIRNEFEYRTELMMDVMKRMNLTAVQFIDAWLSSHVLLNAQHIYTTTLDKTNTTNLYGFIINMN